MPGPIDLYDACDEYLSAVSSALATTDAGTIPRAYVSPGLPPWDCEQLTVHCAGLTTAATLPTGPVLSGMHRIQQTGTVWLAILVATIVRCIPNGTGVAANALPTPAALDDAGKNLTSDLWAAWNYLADLKRAGELFPPKEREFSLEPPRPLPIAGGYAGWEIEVRLNLAGYRAAS